MKKPAISSCLAALLLGLSSHASHASPLADDPLGAFAQKQLKAATSLQSLPGSSTPTTAGRAQLQAPRARHGTEPMSHVVVTALGYLGKPYVYGGQSLDKGFDCSGFVLSLYQRSLGLKLPRTAAEQAHATEKIEKHELAPGDVVFFNTMARRYSHVGIYLGNGRFIHAPRAGAVIRIENMEISYWKQRFNGARRVTTASA